MERWKLNCILLSLAYCIILATEALRVSQWQSRKRRSLPIRGLHVGIILFESSVISSWAIKVYPECKNAVGHGTHRAAPVIFGQENSSVVVTLTVTARNNNNIAIAAPTTRWGLQRLTSGTGPIKSFIVSVQSEEESSPWQTWHFNGVRHSIINTCSDWSSPVIRASDWPLEPEYSRPVRG